MRTHILIFALLLLLGRGGLAESMTVDGQQVTVDVQGGHVVVTLPGADPLTLEDCGEFVNLVVVPKTPTGTHLNLGHAAAADGRQLTITANGQGGGQLEVRRKDGVLIASVLMNRPEFYHLKHLMLAVQGQVSK